MFVRRAPLNRAGLKVEVREVDMGESSVLQLVGRLR